MQRRDAMRPLSLVALPDVLTACGGGGGGCGASGGTVIETFGSDRSFYYVGDTALVTAVFYRGAGRIEPGVGGIRENQEIASSAELFG